MSLMMVERAESYNLHPDWGKRYPSSRLWVGMEQGRKCVYGIWVIGQDYRNKTEYYGAYPNGYLGRLMALFPDVGDSVLHAFSGALPPGSYVRCDIEQPAELRCDVLELPAIYLKKPKVRLCCADPPYSPADALRYGTAMINRGAATRALAGAVRPGGHLAWLDICWPMHSKKLWLTVGRIFIQRSTNHRVRVLSIFERTEEPWQEQEINARSRATQASRSKRSRQSASASTSRLLPMD